jgi:hypothetical protein
MNRQQHISMSVIQSMCRKNGDPMMPDGMEYKYLLPSRVNPGTSIIHQKNLAALKDNKPPKTSLYQGPVWGKRH